jgi:alpha-amylase
MRISTFACLALASAGSALSPAGWRAQSIYQVVTDRFARTDGSTDAVCDTEIGLYCGGTWMGLVDKLDYIQGMGFTAVSGSLKCRG